MSVRVLGASDIQVPNKGHFVGSQSAGPLNTKSNNVLNVFGLPNARV